MPFCNPRQTFSQNPRLFDARHMQTFASAVIPFLSCALAVVICGCASPGQPRPPSLNLPKPVANLTAERVAGDVLLHWTTPTKTTDGVDVKGAMTAEVCRESHAQTSTIAKPECVMVLHLTVSPGASQATDSLPAPLLADPPLLLTYRVRILNAAGRSDVPLSAAFAAAGAAPPVVEAMNVAPARAGAMIEWQPSASNSFVELDRIDIALAKEGAKTAAASSTKPAAATSAKPVTASKAGRTFTKSGGQQPFSDKAPRQTAEIHLSTGDPDSSTASAAGGTIDRTAQVGSTYTYTAQRVRSVVIEGHRLQLRSGPSAMATLVMRDTFPPAVPTGLAAIVNPATANSKASVDLSWEPVGDSDLAGYVVYRQLVTAANSSAERLTGTPVAASAFRDSTALPGQTYAYRITSIDTSGNESKPTADVQEQVND
jgi:hypothetical protein